jgi:hypothetical protein
MTRGHGNPDSRPKCPNGQRQGYNRSMPTRLAIAVLLSVSIISGSSLAPGGVLEATFTSVANTSDLLLFFSNDPLTLTGSPVITTELFNGANLLGSIVAPLFFFQGNHYYQAFFESPSTTLILNPGQPSTIVDLTSMQNGTIHGLIEVTVTGGSISGFSVSGHSSGSCCSPASNFFLYDAVSVPPRTYNPQSNLNNENLSLSSTPEPATSVLFSIGLFGWLTIARYRLTAKLRR